MLYTLIWHTMVQYLLVEGGKNTSILAGMQWAYFRKMGRYCHSQIFSQTTSVHDYYKNKNMQQIYGYNIFPVVQDQIRYDGETNPSTLWMWQP